MAVTASNERTEGVTGSLNEAGFVGTRIFVVTTDDVTDSAFTVCSATGASPDAIPALESAHPDDAKSFCRNISAQITEDRFTWIVKASYEPLPDRHEDPALDPVDELPEISWDFVAVQEAVAKDRNNLAIENSAGDPFPAGVTIERYYLQCSINRNEATFNPLFAADYINTVNNGVQFVAGLEVQAREAKLIQMSATQNTKNLIEYFRVQYRVLFNFDKWNIRILDEGYREKDGAGTNLQNGYVKGAELTTPLKLQSDGTFYSPQVTGSANILEFEVLEQTNWGLLGLNI